MRTEMAKHRLRGQALIELLVASIVLVPLLWALLQFGKYLSIQDSVINASRWLAFECTVRASDCQSNPNAEADSARLWAQQFTAPGTPIQTSPGAPAVAPGAGGAAVRNPLWVDSNNRSLLTSAQSLRANLIEDSFDAGAAVALSGAGARSIAANTLEAAGPERFGLAMRSGLLRFSVDAEVNAVGQSGSAAARTGLVWPRLLLSARSAILVDSWNASGSTGSDPDSVEWRVSRAQDPTALEQRSDEQNYTAIRAWLSLAGRRGIEPDADLFRYRALDVEVLPNDRTGQQP